MCKRDTKAIKIKCSVCGDKFDTRKYEQHHKKCIPINRKK